MTLAKNGFYPSDEIAVLSGFDGTESKDIARWCRAYVNQFPRRIVFAINQHYPELQSGHYFNKNLLSVIQDSFGKIGFSVVIEDNYRREGIVPVEPLASLEFEDDYLLVAGDLKIGGRLRMWESLGGKSSFYHDKIAIEVVLEEKLAEELWRVFPGECAVHQIRFTAGGNVDGNPGS